MSALSRLRVTAMLSFVAITAVRAFPVVAQDQEPELAEYFKIRRVQGASFSHDEKLIAYETDIGGRMDIWISPVDRDEAWQVTHVAGVIHSYAFSPTADMLLYESDDGGNDAPRLYLTDSKGKPPVEIFPNYPKGARIGFIGWSRDGRSILYITNLPGEDFTQVHEYNLQTKRTETIWKSTSTLSFLTASPDFQKLVLMEVLSEVKFNLYLFTRGNKEPVLITPYGGDATYTVTGFSNDSETMYYTSTESGEFASLRALNLSTLQSRLVLEDNWDLEDGRPSPGGKYFLTITNIDGRPKVTVKNLKSGDPLPIVSPDGDGVLTPIVFSRSDRYFAARLTSDVSPDSLYVVEAASGKQREVVKVMPESLKKKQMIASIPVRINSFDGLQIPAFIYKPKGSGPFPAVIEVHGGPTAQAPRRFTPLRQHLVSKGIVVFVPNVRGSSGYGKTYTTLDNLDLGGAPLKDILAGKKWLIENANVDPNRVAIMGASYGGYMVLAAATFAPSEFVAHVDYFGPSDMKTLVESYPPYWASFSPFTFKKWGDPKNPAHASYQYERSPLNFVDRVRRPLLVVQGENDKRVPRNQSDRFVTTLRDRGVEVDYIVLAGEGHGFSNTANRLRAYDATVRFLDKHLAGVRVRN
jgi:dipeptidyl aminopeptidase/acylaminoacyl peptidase